MTKISQRTQTNIYSYVYKDLHPSFALVFFKIFISLFVGGFFSMIFCNQFGLGLSSMADVISYKMHKMMNHMFCIFFCGFIFSIFPAFLLRFMCCGVQFRLMIKKYHVLQAFVVCFISFFMFVFGSNMNQINNIILWFLSVFLSFKCLLVFVDEITDFFYSFFKRQKIKDI